MKFQKKEDLKAFEFITSNNFLYYCFNNVFNNINDYSTVFCRDLQNTDNQWKVDIEGVGAIMKIYEDDLFIQDYNANLFHISLKSGVYLGNLSKNDWKITLSNNLTESKYLLGYRGELMITEYGIYDLRNDCIIFSTNQNLIGFTKKDKIYTKNRKEIRCFSIELKDFLWHFSLSELKKWSKDPHWAESEVFHFVGVVDGVLWVDISCYKNDEYSNHIGSALLGLDVETGAIKHFLHQPEVQLGTQRFLTRNIPSAAKTFYDEKLHKLIGFIETHYWEVDLSVEKPIIKLWDFWDYFGSFKEGNNVMGLEFLRHYDECGITDTHIFAPVGCFGTIPQVFAFNRTTHQVDWRYIMQSETNPYYTPRRVEVSENHLFVFDSEGTLHIFEKEEG